MLKQPVDLKLLESLCNGFGPSGFEDEIQKYVKNYGSSFADEITSDRLGSVILRHGQTGPKIMLAGHADEIGAIVSSIENSGFLKCQPLGGWWPSHFLGHEVLIRPFRGGEKQIGIVTEKSFLILPSEERNKLPPFDQLFVDIGCNTREEVQALGIRVGDPICPTPSFRSLTRIRKDKGSEGKNGKSSASEFHYAISKAFDDRIGVFIALEVLRRISQEHIPHPNTLLCVSTVQEELHARGAQTSAQFLNPDFAFALDVDMSGDAPGVTNIDQKMGAGVSLSAGDFSMIPHPRFRKYIADIADKCQIKWQDAFLRFGGTDAGAIHMTGLGVPSLFVGIPTRYVHTFHSMLDLNDVENAIQLLVEVIKVLDDSAMKEIISGG